MNDESSGDSEPVSDLLAKTSEEFFNGTDYSMMPSTANMSSPVKTEPGVRASPTSKNKVPIEELLTRTLPDYLRHDLDMIFIGINPGLVAAEKQKYYAGSGNHFWKCMYAADLLSEELNSETDYRLPEFGIGLTNMVERTTRGSNDLTSQEMKEGGQILLKKLKEYKPKIAVFNGKEIYRLFSGKKDFFFGKQAQPLEGTDIQVFVMPSSSARCAQLPRVADKIPFYKALKKLRDYLRGTVQYLDEAEVTFPSVLKTPPKRKSVEGGRVTPPLNGANGASFDGVTSDTSQNLSTFQVKQEILPESSGSIFDPFNPQESHFSGSAQQDELERLLANPGGPTGNESSSSSMINRGSAQTDTSAATAAVSTAGFNHMNVHQGITQESSLSQYLSPQISQSSMTGNGDSRRFDPAATNIQPYGFPGSVPIKSELNPVVTEVSMASVQAQAALPTPFVPEKVKLEPGQSIGNNFSKPNQQGPDADLVSQHIRECVAAVVQRCKDGTQDFPEHYIRPSTPPGARAAAQHQQQQQAAAQHVSQQPPQPAHQQHQSSAAHLQSVAQQHTQSADQGSAGTNLLYQAQQGGRSGNTAAANQAALDAAQYLNPYFQQQQQLAAAAYGIPGLQRAMQVGAGNQWQAQDFYNALATSNPYLNQQQSQQQQAAAQQQQFRQQTGQDLYGGAYFGQGYGQNQQGGQNY